MMRATANVAMVGNVEQVSHLSFNKCHDANIDDDHKSDDDDIEFDDDAMMIMSVTVIANVMMLILTMIMNLMAMILSLIMM